MSTPSGDTPRLPVRILVRTDVDWASMDREAFGAQSAAEAPSSFIRFLTSRSALDVWDEVYDVDFFDFRQRLRALTEANLAAVHGARLSIGFDDFAWYHDDEDEMIYPIDDDDYFHPDLADTAPAADEGIDVVAWAHGHYYYDAEGHPQTRIRRVPILFSNNWGIRKSFLRANYGEEQARHLLVSHDDASFAVADHLGIERSPEAKFFEVPLRGDLIRHFDTPYSLSVKHVGSLQTLSKFLRTEDPVGELRRQQVTAHAPVQEELRWCEPWLRQVERIFDTSTPSPLSPAPT
jgi:hypothetical protein